MSIAAAALTGCQRPPQPVELTAGQVEVPDDAAFDRLWESCQEELRLHRFPLDRVDRRAGLITTFPVTSQSLFEFWRHDVDTPFDLLESSLRTVRRTATVQIGPGRGEGEEVLDSAGARVIVTIHRETFATPERQFNSSSAALRVFSEELPGVRGEPFFTKEDDYWIDDGRDAVMEERLLGRILRRAARTDTATVVAEPAATQPGAG